MRRIRCDRTGRGLQTSNGVTFYRSQAFARPRASRAYLMGTISAAGTLYITSTGDARDVDRDAFLVRSQYVVRYVVAFFVEHAQPVRGHCEHTEHTL